jgi:hypothetical protein
MNANPIKRAYKKVRDCGGCAERRKKVKEAWKQFRSK